MISVTSISDNSASVGETAVWAAITNYHIDLETGKVTFGWNASFSVSTKNLRFIYRTGYTDVPDEIKWASEDLAINAVKKAVADNLNVRVKFGRPSPIAMSGKDVFTDEIREMLLPYKKVTI